MHSSTRWCVSGCSLTGHVTDVSLQVIKMRSVNQWNRMRTETSHEQEVGGIHNGLGIDELIPRPTIY